MKHCFLALSSNFENVTRALLDCHRLGVSRETLYFSETVCRRFFDRSTGFRTYVADPVAKARKLPLGRGHDAVGDDFARRVLHVDGGVRGGGIVGREPFRKRRRRRRRRPVLMSGGDRATRDGRQRGDDRDHAAAVDHDAGAIDRFSGRPPGTGRRDGMTIGLARDRGGRRVSPVSIFVPPSNENGCPTARP